jgi:beta-N-acetylhexosaminidase
MSAIGQGRGLLVDALAAAAAGIDLLLLKGDALIQHDVYNALLQAVARALLDPADTLASARRVLALKRRLANRPQPSIDVVGAAEHQALAQEVAERSVTLVRDTAGLLPLRLSPDARIAAVFPQPVDLTPADTSSYVACSLADRLRAYHPQVDEFVTHTDLDCAEIDTLRERLQAYDLVVIGTINATACPGQAALVKAILASSAPTIVVALRMPYDLIAFPEAPTYVCTYSILRPSLDTLARALWGDIPFLGRLPVTIPGMYPRGVGE